MKYGYRTRTITTLTIAYSDLQIIIIRLTTKRMAPLALSKCPVANG